MERPYSDERRPNGNPRTPNGTVLKDGLAQDHSIRWGDFKQPFPEPPPRLPPVSKLPPEPQPFDPEFTLPIPPKPDAELAEKIIDDVVADLKVHPKRQTPARPAVLPISLELALRRRRSSVPATLRGRVEQAAADRFARAMADWEAQVDALLSENSAERFRAERFRRARTEWKKRSARLSKRGSLLPRTTLCVWPRGRNKKPDFWRIKKTKIKRLINGEPAA
jgi:hypothetical protein